MTCVEETKPFSSQAVWHELVDWFTEFGKRFGREAAEIDVPPALEEALLDAVIQSQPFQSLRGLQTTLGRDVSVPFNRLRARDLLPHIHGARANYDRETLALRDGDDEIRPPCHLAKIYANNLFGK